MLFLIFISKKAKIGSAVFAFSNASSPLLAIIGLYPSFSSISENIFWFTGSSSATNIAGFVSFFSGFSNSIVDSEENRGK